jgi:glycosyltransferase involved in cell wall biosynthesis
MKKSVCIPTFNGALHIEEQLVSILDQLSPGDEVIVSDDRSSDATLDVIRGLGDERVKIHTHPPIENPYKGPSRVIYAVYRNVEHALERATGDVVFLSDQDDIWLPDKVARVMLEFERGVELVLHNTMVVDNAGDVLLPSYFSWSKPDGNWVRFVVRCFYQGASMAFTRRVKELALPFPNLAISHDHWIACIEWTHGRNTGFIEEVLMLYRRHGQNVSYSGEKSPNSLAFKIGYRVNMLVGIWLAGRRKL